MTPRVSYLFPTTATQDDTRHPVFFQSFPRGRLDMATTLEIPSLFSLTHLQLRSQLNFLETMWYSPLLARLSPLLFRHPQRTLPLHDVSASRRSLQEGHPACIFGNQLLLHPQWETPVQGILVRENPWKHLGCSNIGGRCTIYELSTMIDLFLFYNGRRSRMLW